MSEDKNTPQQPSTAVVFQAPEPATPRRASAPAGPPAPKSGSASAGDKAPSSSRSRSAGAASTKADAGKSGTAKSVAGKSGATKSDTASKSSATKSGAAKSGAAQSGATKTKAEPKAAQKQASSKQASDDSATASSPSGDGEGASRTRSSAKQEPKAGDKDGAETSPPGGEGDSDTSSSGGTKRRRRGGRGRGKSRPAGESSDDGDSTAGDDTGTDDGDSDSDNGDGEGSSSRRRRRRGSRSSSGSGGDDALAGSTRLQAKRQRRRDSRDGRGRQHVISEAEFLARRESVKRDMVVREKDGRVQIAVLEDDMLVEHYVSHQAEQSMAGNVYLGRVQNVLSGMEAAFVDVGRGRNAVLYAGEVNWDAAGLEGKPRRIELALKPGDTVMVQVTKDPIGHKGARVTSQISLAGRFLVYVPGGGVTGISRKLPDTERARLKKLLREVIPEGAGVIVRTAAEGASEEELRADVERLKRQWESIEREAKSGKAPALLRGEPDMAIRVVRDIFNEDFESLTIQGEDPWNSLSAYVGQVAPDLLPRLAKDAGPDDIFAKNRVDEQLLKALDRKVFLPSGGSLVIDRTEAMTVIDVNTGKFVGKGGTLEETMTLNNLEAAEEIVRQLRLRDIGGIIVIDFVDMLLEANRDRVLRRLIECLGRDRTKHQVAEVTSLGLVQMTRKRVGQGLLEAFSDNCEHCKGKGYVLHGEHTGESKDSGRKGSGRADKSADKPVAADERDAAREQVKATLASIAAAAEKAHHAHPEADADAQAEPAAEAEGVAEAQPAADEAETESDPKN